MTDIITAVSWDTMATAKAGPAMVVHPEREITDEDLSEVAAGSGLNAPFFADLLSSCAAHERMGVSLFTALEAQTSIPAAKKRFSDFRSDALTAVATYNTLLEKLGVPVHYSSAPARMTEAIDAKLVSAFLLAGSADPMTVELKGVEAVMLASVICVSNTNLLKSVAGGLDEGDSTRVALEEACAALEPVQTEHLEWAVGMQQKMVLGQVNSVAVQKVGELTEAVVGKVRDVLGR